MLTERATFGLVILILYEKFNNMHMYITQTSFHFDIFMIFSILNAYIPGYILNSIIIQLILKYISVHSFITT